MAARKLSIGLAALAVVGFLASVTNTSPTQASGSCALQPGPPGAICGGSCSNGTDRCLFDPATTTCRCVPPSVACEQQPQTKCATGLCPSPVGRCQNVGSACACPIP
jgi:hypothetical protein